tara:strand:- start:63 stop:356 length:294 start_codon:yes stop_codon:yes gene_type:complete
LNDNTIVTIERVEKYISLTEEARKKATPTKLNPENSEKLSSMLRMCDDYFSDARYFMQKGDLVRAFGAINYAHAWIDAAVKIGFMDGQGDDDLFTLP